jgi:hypothetical protein
MAIVVVDSIQVGVSMSLRSSRRQWYARTVVRKEAKEIQIAAHASISSSVGPRRSSKAIRHDLCRYLEAAVLTSRAADLYWLQIPCPE